MRINLRYGFCSAALAATSFVIGCAGAPAGDGEHDTVATESSTSAAPAKAINGKLLYSIDRSNDHKIEFYDFGHGAVAAHESLVIGQTAELDAVTKPMSLSEIYRLVEPTRQVPAALVDADASAAQLHDEQAAAAASAGLPFSEGGVEPPSGRGTTVVGNGVKSPAPIHPNVSCSPDYQNDGWSGTWFVNNYCNEGSFRWCQQNYGWANHYDNGHWFRWKQMEGDWNANGHTNGWHEYNPCSWPWACGIQSKTDWDYDILPRHIEIWTYPYDDGYNHGAGGTSTCGHMHVAALWNN